VQQGDSVELGVFGKYVDPKKIRLSPASFVRTGMDKKLIQQLTEYGQNLSTVGVNEIAIANVIALVITELQQKPVPEAYMGYALYDSDSTLYEQGKVILSKKARNKHEELIEKIAIKKDGYIETYLVNETSDDVWFDQFRILSTGPLIVQETHYDPWGVELSGLGYQYGGIKVNPYLYNGKEANGHLGVNMYDFGARMYDPAIGRWFVLDPMAENMRRHSPYNYAFNNPMRFIDPDGMEPYEVMGGVTTSGESESQEDETQKSVLNGEESAPGSCCEEGEIVEGGMMPEFTISAPRDFGGVLGRAAENWYSSGDDRSTYGNIGFNYSQFRTTHISVFNAAGFYLNAITPAGGASFSLEWIKAYNEEGKRTRNLYLTMVYARGVDFGIGAKASRYNSNSNLEHRDIEGFSLQYGIGNYSISHSISTTNIVGGFNGVTSYAVSMGLSPAFPIKTSFSAGVGITVNLSRIF